MSGGMVTTDVSGKADTVLTSKGDIATFDTARVRKAVSATNYTSLQADSAIADGLTYGATARSTLTTAQDLLVASSANTLSRLGKGNDDQVLKMAGSTINWETLASASSNVEILGKTDLSSAGSTIEVLVTQSNIPDDYAFFRVIGGGDTTGSCNANFLLKSAGSYLSEYHQNGYQVKLGTGSDIYIGSDTVLELQSTAEINVARNINFVIDINGNNASGVQWVWNMTGITGCVNLDHRTFSCGTAITGASGLEFDGCKVELDSSINFEEEANMTVLGFKSA